MKANALQLKAWNKLYSPAYSNNNPKIQRLRPIAPKPRNFGVILVNFSETVNGINLFIFALESVIEDASFDYGKPTIRDNSFFDLKGGLGYF